MAIGKPNETVNSHKHNNYVHYNNNNNIDKPLFRHNLLSPNEVTFCDISDEDSSIGSISASKIRRKRLTSTDTDVDSILSTKMKQENKIPDGGYGWVVVFASVFVSLIADGISFSFGLLYTEFLDYFQESKSKTAWIGSIFLAVPLLSGPIMSNLVDRYGCRKMTIIGGILSGTGFILAAVSNSIEMLYWTFGVIGGLGLGIGYVTAVVSIAFWFDKTRTFATGIGASGTGIGTFIYAPFTQWLIQTFGWRGACLILAGTLLNICVCGSLMRDPDWLIESNRLESRSQSMQTFSNSSVCLDEIKKLIETGAPNETVLQTLVTNYNTEANQQISDPNDELVVKKCISELQLPTYLCSHEFEIGDKKYGSRRSLRRKAEDGVISKNEILAITLPGMTTTHTTNTNHHLASSETLNASEKMSLYDDRELSQQIVEYNDNGYLTGIQRKKWSDDKLFSNSRLSLQESVISKPIEDIRRSFRGNSLDVLYEHNGLKIDPSNMQAHDKQNNDISIPIPINVHAMHKTGSQKKRAHHMNNGNLKRSATLRNSNYFRDMRIHRNSIHYRGAMLNTHRYRLRASSCPNIYRNSMTTLAKEDDDKWYDSFLDIIKSIFDFSLFLDPKFAYFSVSTLLLFIWFIVPYFYLPEHMLKYGYTEEDSSKIISAIGMFNTIGMIFLGWTGDQPWLNIHKTYACCLVVCGFSVAMMPVVVESYIWLLVFALIFGLTFASSFSFTPIILVRLVDLDEFTCAYGLVLLVQGVGNLVGPPIAGLMYEFTGIWDSAFYAGGFFIALSGVFVYMTGYLEDREEEQADSIDIEKYNSDDK